MQKISKKVKNVKYVKKDNFKRRKFTRKNNNSN